MGRRPRPRRRRLHLQGEADRELQRKDAFDAICGADAQGCATTRRYDTGADAARTVRLPRRGLESTSVSGMADMHLVRQIVRSKATPRRRVGKQVVRELVQLLGTSRPAQWIAAAATLAEI